MREFNSREKEKKKMHYPAWVYSITLDATGKKYIGISHNPKKRLSAHLWALRHGKHPVEDMQADYNRFGSSISFHILEEVREQNERNKEFKWQLRLRTLERGRGYNYKDPVTNWCIPLPKHYEERSRQ
jgi:hypothetical protein